MKARLTVLQSTRAFAREIRTARSTGTAHAYETALNSFLRFLRELRLNPRQMWVARLHPDDFVGYGPWLAENGNGRQIKASTRGTYLAAVLAWLRYLIREGSNLALAGAGEKIRDGYATYSKRERHLPRLLSEQEISQLIGMVRMAPAGTHPRGGLMKARDLALLEGLRCTGARIGELTGANVVDLNEAEQSLRVLGKGRKERTVFFDEKAWDALTTYLKGRESLDRSLGAKSAGLFARHNEASWEGFPRLGAGGARAIVKKYERLAGLQIHASPHRFRHSFATKILAATGDLAVTQDLLGHSSPSTTRIYASITAHRMKEAHRKAFPDGTREAISAHRDSQEGGNG